MELFHTRRACLPPSFYFCLGFHIGSKSNIRISASLLHYVSAAVNKSLFTIDDNDNADAKSLSSCTTLLSMLIIFTARVSLGPSAFAALCFSVIQISAICAISSLLFKVATTILFSGVFGQLSSKDFKFASGVSREMPVRSAQSGDISAHLAFVNSLVNHAACLSSWNVEGTFTGGALAFFRHDIDKEGDVPFIRGRGTGRFLKRTGREWEPSRIYGKWVDSHFKGLVGWAGLRWLVLVNADCKRPLYRLNVPTGGVYGLPAQWGSLVVLRSMGLWMVLPEAWRWLLAVLLGRCPRSLFSFYMVVLCSLGRTENPFRRRGGVFLHAPKCYN